MPTHFHVIPAEPALPEAGDGNPSDGEGTAGRTWIPGQARDDGVHREDGVHRNDGMHREDGVHRNDGMHWNDGCTGRTVCTGMTGAQE